IQSKNPSFQRLSAYQKRPNFDINICHMQATMSPNNAHKDIPGNPSTATSSRSKLRTSLEGTPPLKVLTEADWQFWLHNGYVVIKNAVPKEQVAETARFLWEFEEKDAGNPDTWYT